MSCSDAAIYLRRRVYQLKVAGRSRQRNAVAWMPLLIAHEMATAAQHPKPDCFGLSFDANEDPACAACPVQVSCMHRCAHVALPKAIAAAKSYVAEDLAKATRWSAAQVHLLQQVCCLTGTLRGDQVNACSPRGTLPSEPSARWPRRFMQERRRMPKLGYLPIGTRIVRTYGGVDHIVTLLDGTYFYGGEYYPTLYAVASSITGYKQHPQAHNRQYRRLIGNYSAAKFFGSAIEKAMPIS
jgi:hypothetical protein